MSCKTRNAARAVGKMASVCLILSSFTLVSAPQPAHAGLLNGALTGAVAGGLIGGKKGARKGALIGGIIGAVRK
jgi:uncharacterized protein YcfJ